MFLALFGCNSQKVEKSTKESSNIKLSYATGFTIQETKWGHIVSVFDLDNNKKLKARYGLSTNSNLIPDTLIKIKTPIKQVACLSTTHIPMFDALNSFDAISGVAYAKYIKNEAIHTLIDKGQILEIDGASGLDAELLLASKAKYLMVYPYEDEGYGKYANYGVQLIYNAEYAEKHPLGKAEWIKFVGLLTNKLPKANAIFDGITKRYLIAKGKAEKIVHKPTVFAGSYFKGMWNAPNANSLVAKLLSDAGAEYVFKDTSHNGNIIMDKETFLAKAVDVDFWGRVVNNSQVVDWPLEYEVLKEFKSIKKQQAFYCDVTKTDYFGAGTIQPDVILNDLISVFHPGLTNHTPVYFMAFNTKQYPNP